MRARNLAFRTVRAEGIHKIEHSGVTGVGCIKKENGPHFGVRTVNVLGSSEQPLWGRLATVIDNYGGLGYARHSVETALKCRFERTVPICSFAKIVTDRYFATQVVSTLQTVLHLYTSPFASPFVKSTKELHFFTPRYPFVIIIILHKE